MRQRIFGMVLAALLMGGLLPAQMGRGSFTGTVTDSSGAVIPRVNVTIRNVDTDATYHTTTTSDGVYIMPSLPTGSYDLTFEATGLRTLIQRGVLLSVAEVRRVDTTLAIGAVSDSIEVTAQASRIQTDSADVSTTFESQNLANMPLSISGGRLIENFVYKLVPGATGYYYNGFINGGETWGVESLLDGATVMTEMQGYFGEMSVSLEAVQEFKAQTSALSAEYGKGQGGVFSYVMKSGTNTVHGSAFGSLRNEALDANTFVNNYNGTKRALDRQNDYAFSLGAPVFIPKIYNGKNKTFFFATVEKFDQANMALASPSATWPIPAFYQGDFSRLLGPATGNTDALGNSVAKGAIYDPTTFYQLPNGRWAGFMFPGNQIPVSRFSRVAQNLNAIAEKYYLPTITGADGQIPLQHNAQVLANDIYKLDQWQYSVKMDQNLSDNHKLSGSLSVNNRPRLQGGGSGMFNPTLPDGGPLSIQASQHLMSYFARVAHDWIVSPTKVNHFAAYYNRFTNFIYTGQKDVHGAAALGISGLSDTVGYPVMNWGGGPYTPLNNPGYGLQYAQAYNTYGLMDTFSFSRGRHFMKAGFDATQTRVANGNPVSGTQFNFSALSTSIPNETFSGNMTGYSFASYLLGIVYSGSMPRALPSTDVEGYAGLYFQDDYQVTKRLTLNLGIRWDYLTAINEAHDRTAAWTPALIDPKSGLPGAYAFKGNCSQCSGNEYFGRGNDHNFAPRFGFAYRLAEGTSLRGGYAIFFQTSGTPNQSNSSAITFPFVGTWQVNAKATNAWQGIFNIDSGVSPSFYSQPAFDRSWGDSNQPAMFDPSYPTMPYIQHWSFNVQSAIARNWVLDVGYIGSKGTRLRGDSLEVLNQLQPSVLQQFGRSLLNSVTNATQAAANGIAYPFPGFSGTVASALRPYPQVVGNSTISVLQPPLGFNTTNQLQVALEKKSSRGLTGLVNYVWSKTMGDVWSTAGSGNTVQNYYNLAAEKAVATYDVPHNFKAMVTYELPVGKGKPLLSGAGGVLNGLLGGWVISVVANYSAGLPLAFSTSSSPLAGAWNGGVRPNVAPGDMLASGFSTSNFNLANPSSPSNTYLNKSLYSDIQPLTLGTAAPRYAQARGLPSLNEDATLVKSFRIRERWRVQVRGEAYDLLNRHVLGGLNTNVTNALFGQMTSVSGNRTMQVGARLDF